MESISKYSSLHDVFQSNRTTDLFLGDMKGLRNLLKKEIISLLLLATKLSKFKIQGQ